MTVNQFIACAQELHRRPAVEHAVGQDLLREGASDQARALPISADIYSTLRYRRREPGA